MLGEPDRWRIECLARNFDVDVSTSVVAALVAFTGGRGPGVTIAELSEMLGVPHERIADTVAELVRLELLMEANDHCDEAGAVGTARWSHAWAREVAASWARYGWSEAADYFLATWGYPFLSYEGPDAARADDLAMQAFLEHEPDLVRFKKCAVTTCVPAPPTLDVLDGLSMSFASVWDQYSGLLPAPGSDGAVKDGELLEVLSAVFGVRGEFPSLDARAAPLIRKTSPSGGARHPTECYVVALTVAGLEPGLYHFAAGTSTLDYIDRLPPAERLQVLFDGLYRSRQERGFEPSAFLLFSAVFKRSMFRYREPRSLRTVLEDIGHLTSTLELVATATGHDVYCQHGVADGPLEDLLGLDFCLESILYGAALGLPNSYSDKPAP